MENTERVMIFIDGSNNYHILKNMINNSRKLSDFNYRKFINYITGNRRLVKVCYYNCSLDSNLNKQKYKNQQRFFEKLKRIPGFRVVLCRMQKVKIHGQTIYQVKEDDIHLAVDLIKYAYKDAYDTAVLVSSDGDFVPAILAAREAGKRIENIGYETKFSYHLQQKSDRFIKLKKQEILQLFN